MRLGARLTPSPATAGTTPGKTYRNAEWELLRAARVLPPELRPQRHVLDLVSGAKEPTVGLVGNHGHAWVRLIEPSGNLYSVGFYPDESTDVSPERWPGLTFPGMLLHPDKWDRAGWHELVTRYEIDRVTFERIAGRLQDLQAGRSRGSLPFRLLDLNCVWLVAEMAAMVDVEVDIEYSLAHHLTAMANRRLQRRSAGTGLVDGIGTGGRRPTRLLANLAGAVAGGRRTFSTQWVGVGAGAVRRDIGFQPMQRTAADALTRPVPFNHVIAFQRWQRNQAATLQPGSGRLAAAPDEQRQPGPPDRAQHDATGTDGHVDQGGFIDQ